MKSPHDLELGEPWRLNSKNQGIAVPILEVERYERDYVLLSEAESKRNVTLRDTGDINIAEAINNSDINVFIRKGTMLKGDTQERAVIHSVVVAPRTTFMNGKELEKVLHIIHLAMCQE